ncbi:MAG: hypothetical protein R3D58_13265 [Saprospiraceae bacterium]
MEQKGVNGGGSDPVSAIANAAASLFGLLQSALAPGIISAQAYFQQLLNAQPKLQDPFAQINADRRATDRLLIYAGVGVIILLLLIILFRRK